MTSSRHDLPATARPRAGSIPFVGVADMARLVREVGVGAFVERLAGEIASDFRRWPSLSKSARHAAHAPGGVLELMPADDGALYAFKYVNGHPGNAARGLQTVAAFGMLADMATGYPLLLAEMTLATALRTAATSALAARHMARRDSSTMAIIGNGAQSEFQAVAFATMLGIVDVRLYDVDPAASEKCARNLRAAGIEASVHGSVADAVLGVDVVTTATADKRLATVLTHEDLSWAAAGVHVNAIGGDCPGKCELEPAILKRARIVVEYEPQTRIEGEIQRLTPNHPVTELHSVLRDHEPGRRSDAEVTVFDSVGFAVEDFATLRLVHTLVSERGDAPTLDLVADPEDPKDLYGLLRRA